MKQYHILLAEDEQSLARGLEYNLSSEGYLVTLAVDGHEALKYLAEQKFDLAILDIMLPFVDGFGIAEKIRQDDIQMPILFLTARTGIQDRVKGLKIGADDYMTKPFHLEELLLKIKGMLLRKTWYKKASDETPHYKFAKYTIDFNSLVCKGGSVDIQLTLQEAMLLKYLMENKGRVVSRDELLDKVWNVSSAIETRTVDNFIARLRKYFEPNPDKPRYIKSIRGVGYLFTER